MATLPTRSFSLIVQNIAAGIQGRTSALVDFTAGSPLRAIAESFAGAALWLQTIAIQTLAVTRLATSSGSDVDSFVNDFGLTRLAASPSSGYVTFGRFTAGSSAPFIPVGTQVQTSDGTQTFQVIADPTNSAYSSSLLGYTLGSLVSTVAVTVQALTPGVGANVSIGQISVLISPTTGIDYVVNNLAFTGGTSAETDAQLKARFVNYIASLREGTVPAILYAAQSYQAGAGATVIENVNTLGNTQAGYLLVTVDDGSGYPSSTFVNGIAAALANVRAGGIQIGVFAPIPISVSIAVTTTTSSTYSHAAVIAAVAAAITTYLGTLQLGQTLSYGKLYQIVFNASAGVTDCVLTINGATADITVGQRNKILLGSLTVV